MLVLRISEHALSSETLVTLFQLFPGQIGLEFGFRQAPTFKFSPFDGLSLRSLESLDRGIACATIGPFMQPEQLRRHVSAFRSSCTTPDKRSLIMRHTALALEYLC
jgi:hypothetical protein